jgi:hypothetical protein
MGITEGFPNSAAGDRLSPDPATEADELEAVLLIRGIRGGYRGANALSRYLGRPTISTHCLWRKTGSLAATPICA